MNNISNNCNYFIVVVTAMLPVCAKMMNTLSKMCSGARRSFFCRMKCKVFSVKEEADTTTGSKYTQSGNFDLFFKQMKILNNYYYLHISSRT